MGASTGQCFQQSSRNTEMQLCSNCRRITSLRSLFIFSHKSHKLLFLEQQQTNAHIRRSGSPRSPSPSWSETGYQLPQAACRRLWPGTSGSWGRGLSPHPPIRFHPPHSPWSSADCHSTGPDLTGHQDEATWASVLMATCTVAVIFTLQMRRQRLGQVRGSLRPHAGGGHSDLRLQGG